MSALRIWADFVAEVAGRSGLECQRRPLLAAASRLLKVVRDLEELVAGQE